MLDGHERRKKIMEILRRSEKPVSGSALAAQLGVSRQVIVQDIALLRAVEKDILATARGYLLFHKHQNQFFRCFYVNHTSEAIRDELMVMVENGGKVLDVTIDHDVYGQISAALELETVADVAGFCEKILASRDKPLNILADGAHMHTVEASSLTILDNIERALNEKGYLQAAHQK